MMLRQTRIQPTSESANGKSKTSSDIGDTTVARRVTVTN
jgi:hypothetical protein